MKKIPTMFVREMTRPFRVTPVLAEGCEWVAAGEGVATKKWDGTCCMVKDGKLYKRYDGSKSHVLPSDFLPADGAESHWHGWRPVADGPEDKWHNEARNNPMLPALADGTYELIGPAINKNPERVGRHEFRKHGDVVYELVERTFDGLKKLFEVSPYIEGIVFHHSDGRMAKIKLRDFGIVRLEMKSTVQEILT